jgi:hypothetical protein
MPNSTQDFSFFEFSASQDVSLRTDFILLMADTTLYRCNRVDQIIADYKKVPGIYFWVMRHGGRRFRIYIGKTNSMSNRIQNYVVDFQPHSPNDYKLRIFQEFLAGNVPGATLDLYFSPKSLTELTQAENHAVSTYEPLLNQRRRPSADARAALRDAFSRYYRSTFEQLLQNND